MPYQHPLLGRFLSTSFLRQGSKEIVLQRTAFTELRFEIESPPLVLYNKPSISTGAILSGQLKIIVTDVRLEVENFTIRLISESRIRKPYNTHCKNCGFEATELKNWKLNHGLLVLDRGEHHFPFSCLIEGKSPATTCSELFSINYILEAIVTTSNRAVDPVILTNFLDIKRAILPSDLPRRLIRTFQPTDLTVNIKLPSIIHSFGDFTCSLRIDGVLEPSTDIKIQTQWMLKNLIWRLEETQKFDTPLCSRHRAQLGATPAEKERVLPQRVRLLNSKKLEKGWKSDYTCSNGSIEYEFSYSIPTNAHPLCNINVKNRTKISHCLTVEMTVARGTAPIIDPYSITPTGEERVLRMYFDTVLTERSGMGISWDKEQPPLYQDITTAPPKYLRGDILSRSPIDSVSNFYDNLHIISYEDSERSYERQSLEHNGGDMLF